MDDDSALGAREVATNLARDAEWQKSMAHTIGAGWFLREATDCGLWARDPNGTAVRNRIRAVTTGNNEARARDSLRTREIERELADELDVPLNEWDAGDVVGLPDGRVLNLADGAVTMAPDARISMRLAVAPERGEPVIWLRVLAEAFGELFEPEIVIAWFRWWCRYSLGTSCAAEVIVFLFGPPGSGKSTIADTWALIVGDYGATVDGSRLVGDSTGHSQWLAGLRGARVVRINELPDRGRWDAARLNALASGETIEANRMRENSVEFRSVSKVLVTGNHRPRAASGSGFWRRIRMIECRHAPAEPDSTLKEKLRAEGGRILRWALAAPAEQPPVPSEVTAVVQRYRDDSDPLADWLAACVTEDGNAYEPVRALRESYEQWSRAEGQEPIQARTFGTLLTERFGDKRAPIRVNGRVTKCRIGLRLNAAV